VRDERRLTAPYRAADNRRHALDNFEHGFWGGVTVRELRASGDKTKLGIDHWARRGIAGRCVLLDVARVRASMSRLR
jgi:hypothetical protein